MHSGHSATFWVHQSHLLFHYTALTDFMHVTLQSLKLINDSLPILSRLLVIVVLVLDVVYG